MMYPLPRARRVTVLDNMDTASHGSGSRKGATSAGKVSNRRRTAISLPEDNKPAGPTVSKIEKNF